MRSIQIFLGASEDAAWRAEALRLLADAVLTDEEAGQRGAKVSKLIQMLADASIADTRQTAVALRQIKAIIKPLSSNPHARPEPEPGDPHAD